MQNHRMKFHRSLPGLALLTVAAFFLLPPVAPAANELRQATYAKIKPVLSAVQLESFEKLLAKMQPKKK